MNLDINDKVFFVAGSTRGIGLGIAKVLLGEECKVIINGRNSKKLQQVKEELIDNFPDNIAIVKGDVNDFNTIEAVSRKALEKWGHLDGVVANVGAVKNVHKWRPNEEDWNWYFNKNFSVAVNTIQTLVPLISKRKGAIVIIGSIAGLEDVGAPIPYASSKAALLAYTKSLSRRLADKKIRVNMVSPGNILFPEGNWDKKQQSNHDQVQQMLQEKIPLQMFGAPEDIGNVVAFLFSSRARFITGANIVVDGGQTSSLN